MTNQRCDLETTKGDHLSIINTTTCDTNGTNVCSTDRVLISRFRASNLIGDDGCCDVTTLADNDDDNPTGIVAILLLLFIVDEELMPIIGVETFVIKLGRCDCGAAGDAISVGLQNDRLAAVLVSAEIVLWQLMDGGNGGMENQVLSLHISV